MVIELTNGRVARMPAAAVIDKPQTLAKRAPASPKAVPEAHVAAAVQAAYILEARTR
jgi:hypothetical protein